MGHAGVCPLSTSAVQGMTEVPHESSHCLPCTPRKVAMTWEPEEGVVAGTGHGLPFLIPFHSPGVATKGPSSNPNLVASPAPPAPRCSADTALRTTTQTGLLLSLARVSALQQGLSMAGRHCPAWLGWPTSASWLGLESRDAGQGCEGFCALFVNKPQHLGD